MRTSVLILSLLFALQGAAIHAEVPGGELPDIGNPASTTLSVSEEYRIGLAILRELRQAGQVVEDPEINEYLQSLGLRLASEAQEGGYRFRFFAVKDTGINAFALPGGFIGVNAGLVTATRSESELAGVLAHEIAHVTQRHIARSVQQAGRANLASAAAILAAVLLGATTGLPGDAMMGTISAAQGLAAQQQINFTRSNEIEADRVGIGILAAASFNPAAMPDFFQTMQQRTGSGGRNIPELLRTHPVTTERIAETRDRASQHTGVLRPDSAGYALIRERLAVQSLPPEAPFRDLYAAAASADQPASDGQVYGRALALARAGDLDTAIGLLSELRDRRPDITLYHTALGQAQLEAGRSVDSRATLEHALQLFPRNVPVTVRYAEALLRDGDARRAHVVLLDLFNNVPPTPEQARFTAVAANAAGDVADAYYYLSEYHVMNGDLPLAIDQLRMAQAVPGINGVQRERFDARIQELQEYLPKGRRAREVPGAGAPEQEGRAPR
ncbi:MAG: M48 family peptidase [Gammaproteobacteria bacterium]|nr:MAG: M48 family peptidase [Gammaproteobacteria bacterium]